jgi:hypothetical protein
MGSEVQVTDLGWEADRACQENGSGVARMRAAGGVTEMGGLGPLSRGVER